MICDFDHKNLYACTACNLGGEWPLMEYFPREEEPQLAIYIPGQLEVDERPELLVFPAEIIFGQFINGPILKTILYSEYIPDVDSYKRCEVELIRYLNRFSNGGDYINLAYDKDDDYYHADKYVNGELSCSIAGVDWTELCAQMGGVGIGKAEGFTVIFDWDFSDSAIFS